MPAWAPFAVTVTNSGVSSMVAVGKMVTLAGTKTTVRLGEAR